MGLQDSKAQGCKATSSEGEIDWITLDEVNALLMEAQGEPEDDGFYTSKEWALRWGVSRQTALTKLMQLSKHGLAESRDVIRRNSRGHLYPTVAYCIKENENALGA